MSLNKTRKRAIKESKRKFRRSEVKKNPSRAFSYLAEYFVKDFVEAFIKLSKQIADVFGK